MSRFAKFLALACCVISAGVGADQVPATGKLLVATDEVRGLHFAETVILLLHYDETGTLGLVVNRPIAAAPIEALPELEHLADYRGTLYWGGPVRLTTMRALLLTDTPPDDAVQIFDAVHLVHMDETLLEAASNAANLRFFMGYAGWAPGQLERELAFDSWHILPATAELVFAEDPSDIWRRLVPPREYRAAAEIAESGVSLLTSSQETTRLTASANTPSTPGRW
jgi:putative transcriptional regulator